MLYNWTEMSENDSWQRLLAILGSDPRLSQEATDAVQEYTEGAHSLGHELVGRLVVSGGSSCQDLTEFLLGVMRLGYLRARVGSTGEGGTAYDERMYRSGETRLSDSELGRLLEGIKFDL